MRELEELGRTISADPPIPPLPISEIEARAGRHRTRPRALAVGVVVVVLAVSAGLLAAIRPTTHPQHRRGSERGHSRTWVTRLEVGEALGVAADNQTVWVAGVNVVRRIDPIRNAITATIAVPGTSDLRSVSLAFGSVWVTDTGTQRVTRVDPASNRVVATIPVGGSPTGTAGAGGLLWVAIPNPNTPGISFAPVDPFTNAVGEPITLTRGGPDPFPTLTSDGPQVVIEWAQRVWVLDPRARTVLPFGPPGLRGVYAAGADQDGVLAIDQRSRVVRLDHDRIGQIGAVVPGGLALTTDPTSVWVLARKNARSDPQLVRLDHRTLRPVGRPTTLPSFWSGAAAQYNRVWVGVDGELVRVDTRPRPTRPDLCPSAAPIEYWGADGLPPEERVTTDPDAESQELSRESERLERRYPTATDFTIGPGYGRAWSRETGRVVVSAVEDAAIIVHFPGRRACPKGNGPPIGVPTARNMPVLLAALL
jgi:YVTN family beta-propeller protein